MECENIIDRLARLETKVDIILERMGNGRENIWKHGSMIAAILALIISLAKCSPHPVFPKQDCNEIPLVTNGIEAPIYPAVMGLATNISGGISLCTAVMITKDIALTARHCDVEFGESGLFKTISDGRQLWYKVVDTIPHRFADLRLIKINKKVESCMTLASHRPQLLDPGIVVGYGWDYLNMSVGLKKFAVARVGNVLDFEVRIYKSPKGTLPGGGDSGGPLVVDGYVIGILSHCNGPDAQHCTSSDYIRVDKFYNWIMESIEDLNN